MRLAKGLHWPPDSFNFRINSFFSKPITQLTNNRIVLKTLRLREDLTKERLTVDQIASGWEIVEVDRPCPDCKSVLALKAKVGGVVIYSECADCGTLLTAGKA